MTRAILCDIEGTIGSIRFVREVLFPYAARALPGFVRTNLDEPAVAAQLDAVARDGDINRQDTEGLIDQLLSWIESDTKATPLKALQGMIWDEGYRSGDYQGHVYDDAFRNLQTWRRRGYGLHIFSSGSVQAQQLYFRYSSFGDMRMLFGGWFDTTTGPKQEPSSYSAIAAILGEEPGDILFLSDVAAELDAASAARLRTTWIVRPEDSQVDIGTALSRHPLADSFDAVSP